MSVFAVFAGAAGTEPDAAEIEIVGDRFSFFALLLTPVWAAWHRLWFLLAAVVTLAVALLALVAAGVVTEGLAEAVWWLVAALVGFESGPIREAALTRRGFVRRTDLPAHNASEAELRWLARVLR